MNKPVDIRNKKASFEFSFIDKYVAGMQLMGSEIKSIRESKANIGDAFCYIHNGELFVKNMHISEYNNAGSFGHAPLRDRKLLLTRKELKKIAENLKVKGISVIPIRLFINEKGFAKLELAVAKGKKIFDKRDSIKKRDVEREISRHHR